MLGQFKWVYAFLSPIGGYLADRFGRRHIISGSLFAWSAVTCWTGHVISYSELLTARTLMGVSEAFTPNPAIYHQRKSVRGPKGLVVSLSATKRLISFGSPISAGNR